MAPVAERRPSRPKRGRAKPAAAAAPVTAAGKAANVSVAGFSLRELNRLIRLVQRTGIGELELNAAGRSVRISATSAGPAMASPVPGLAPAAAGAAPLAAAAAKAEATPAKEPAADHKPIVSPMVGTFYRSPAPDADPFVDRGDVIEAGQTVCIIEAMKLMNEIQAESRGRVVEILVENAQPVEFGQKLFLVEPL
jgi:acetyl-CoA carboxylase biotin carboxyl carrier protein